MPNPTLVRRLALPKKPGLPALVLLLLVLLGTAAARTAATRKATRTSAVYTVTATAYEAVASQTDSKPFITADNSRIPRGYGSHTRWLALSRDLLRPWGGPFAFGDKVRVEGMSPALDGVYTVHDTMNRRYRHRLDVLAHPREHLNLSRPGVRLRRVGSSQASRELPRTGKAASPRLSKATPRLAAKRPATRQNAKRRQPANALVATAKRATHPAKRQPQARRKPRVARPLAASPKRLPQRQAARLLVAHR